MLRIVVLVLSLFGVNCAPREDFVRFLPGAPKPLSSNHYSGYLNATEGRFFHYWFTESMRDPENDPVVLWLNGGPGCSSLLGFLTELGPYHTSPDGISLTVNDNAWNTVANIIYLESPACVGFSYSISGCGNSDDNTALGNYLALQHFFDKFPEYRNNKFYITGESYAGVYIPTLALLIMEGQYSVSIPLEAYAIGNGLLSYTNNYNSMVFFARYHMFIDDNLWNKLITNCCEDGIQGQDTCHFFDTVDQQCQIYYLQAQHIIQFGGVNPYNMYGDCEKSSHTNSNVTTRLQVDLETAFSTFSDGISLLEGPVCTNSYPETTYLNNPEVREALHVTSDVNNVETWKMCFGAPERLLYKRTYFQVRDELTRLNKEFNLRGLIYSGDADLVVNTIGNQWDIAKLDLNNTEDTRTWYHEGQVAGFVKRMLNLDFVTIRAAGHMVPTDKPSESLKMFESFLSNTKLL